MATITGLHAAQPFVIEQVKVARYVAIEETAGGFTIPGPDHSSDRHIQGIAFPGVMDVASAIFFRTRHTGLPRFSVRVNEKTLTQFAFSDNDPPERCWHEIILARALRPENNELIFGVSGEGAVTFGDVLILYTSHELTVKVPIVVTTSVSQ